MLGREVVRATNRESGEEGIVLDDLVGCIELLQVRMKKHRNSLERNEIRTRVSLIDPLLCLLGWDVSDPELVTPEYTQSDSSVGSSSWAADYALLHSDGRPAAVLEAKRLGEPLATHRMQMLNYANAWGIEYAGLTDGNHWELYRVFEPGRLEERRILEVAIRDTTRR